MKNKKLIETLAIQIAVPDPGYSINVDNILSAWGSIPYAQLSVILVHLRFLSIVHQTHHWICKGDTFYGDHLLFERLYNSVVGEIDEIAEKSIGLGCVENVNLTLQLQQMNQLLQQSYGVSSTIPQPSELAKRSFIAEVTFLRCISHCVQSMKEMGTLTRGLDNLLAGIEDNHENLVYLLKQRCGM